MRADKAALGVMPTMAFRHCEPMRTASSFGWYIFPPQNLAFKWNGADVLYAVGGEWRVLTSAYLDDLAPYWDAHAPEAMQGLAPPFLTHMPVRGFVQIWSGLMCSMKADWSMLIRPLANVRGSNMYSCFEGVVEFDRFKPSPLFINIQLLATDVVIEIPKLTPLFQVQPLMRATYGDAAHTYAERDGLGALPNGEPAMSADDWAGYRNTIRVSTPEEAPESGQYAVTARKRGKQGE